MLDKCSFGKFRQAIGSNLRKRNLSALMFAGAAILFAFVRLVGHEPLWQAILGEHYQRLVKLAVEEFIELIGYLLWLVGCIEYTYQARSLAEREPQPAAVRRRQAAA